MALRIDWDNYEVVEAEDFELIDLENTIEDVREVMDYLSYSWKGIPDALEELMIELNDMEEVQNGKDQG